MNALAKPPKTLVPVMIDTNNKQPRTSPWTLETLWQNETRMVRQQSMTFIYPTQVEKSCWSSMAMKGRRKALWSA